MRFAATVLLLVAASRALGTEAGPQPSYRLDHWSTTDGLPSSQVRDLLEGPGGYLWIATPAGLVRFDGLRFHRIDRRSAPALPTNRIQSLYAARDGSIWFGGADFLMRVLPDGAVEPVAEVEGLVHAVAEDSTGRVWIYRDEGRLSYLDEGRLLDAPEERAEGFVTDARGNLWIRTVDGALVRAEGDRREGSEQRQQVPASPLWVLHRKPLTSSQDGSPLDTRGNDGRIEVRETGGALVATYPEGPGAMPWLVDRRGRLWVARSGTVEAYEDASGAPIVRHELGPDVLVSEILEDREGNLWIGTRARGLFRLRPNFIEPFEAPPAQLFRGFVRDASGTLLVRAEDGLYRVGRAGLTPMRTGSGDRVRSLHVDARGRTWIGDGRRLTGVVTIDGVTGHSFAQVPDDEDGFWMADPHGLFRVHAGDDDPPRVERRFAGRVSTLPLLHVDRSGRLWIATSDGLYRLRGDELEVVELGDALAGAEVRAFHDDADGTLWLGTVNHGLVRLRDGTAQAIDTSDGLVEDGVFAILEDDAGRFWMSGYRGIFRAERERLEGFLDGRADHVECADFGDESILINPEEGGDLGAESDGVLWFSTHSGVVRIDPALADRLSTTPPRVHIEQVRSAQEDVPIEANGVILPAGRRGIDVGFTAISLRDAEALRFEVRLDPYDREWVRIGSDRHMRYAQLPPGHYTFRVRARSGAGVWSAAEGRLPVTAQPHPWETTAFRVAALLMVGLALFGLVQLRLRGHRRRAEELDRQVRERTEDLAREHDRLTETTRVIEAQARELEELDVAKSRFFANVSHEFRTPLTLVLGPLGDVLEGRHGEVSDDVAEQIRLANQNAARLLRLVNQLLDLASLEAGRLKLAVREEDLAAFLRRIAAIFDPLAGRHGIEFVAHLGDRPLPVWFDAEQLEKVVVNLLANAFKFTPTGGRVELECGGDGDEVRFCVRDNGRGLAPEEQDRIFERFYRSPDGETEPGTGIGLALARDVVELHHGTIRASGRRGEGATFEVRLKRGDGHFDAGEKAASSLDDLHARLRDARLRDAARHVVLDATSGVVEIVPADGDDRTTVLVVEDNDEMRAFVRSRLAPHYRVREASDGEQALAILAESVPDLVVSDLMMPRMDGLELCRRVKADPEFDFVPFVLLTAKATVDDRVEGLTVGADDYLPKPFDERELLARVANLLESRKRLERRLRRREEMLPDIAGLELEDDDFADRVHRAIDARLGDDAFGIDELARELGVSRRTLYRRTQESGLSPAELIQNRRLDHAAALLDQRRGNVTEVAYAVGFRSVSHFSRRFRERHGVSPSARRGGSAN